MLSVVRWHCGSGHGELVRIPGDTDDEPDAIALHMPPPAATATDMTPTVVYFHGNADQIGWGGAYVGKLLQEWMGFGVYAVEYPGYGYANQGSPSEQAIYESSERLLKHLVAPISEGGNIALCLHAISLTLKTLRGWPFGRANDMQCRTWYRSFEHRPLWPVDWWWRGSGTCDARLGRAWARVIKCVLIAPKDGRRGLSDCLAGFVGVPWLPEPTFR